MAYSNWGAFVYKDGKRRKNREDVAVFNDDESEYPSGVRIFANILKNRAKYGDDEQGPPFYEHSHHAVLGDLEVRLCGYKSWPELYSTDKDGKVTQHTLPEAPDDGYERDGEGDLEIDGKIWHWKFHQYDGNMVDLELTEPDGSKWTSTCGYMYGAGFEEEE